MDHYSYQKTLQTLWEKAVERYRAGQRGAASYFSPEELEFLAGIGVTAQEVYDYAEDYANGGDPDFPNMATVLDIRRAYFLEVQGGVPSGHAIDMDQLPPKDAAVEGISWLPRMIPKAQAKLRGEMPPELMYGCGGDRRFFRENNLHPAEFLRKTWECGEDTASLIAWVKRRRSSR